MNIIGCLDVPTSGTYHLGGVDVSTMNDDQRAEIRNRMLGFIFQQYNLIPKLTVQENVELPLLYAGVPGEERHERAIRLWSGWVWRISAGICPASSPAASSSAWRLPAWWRHTRASLCSTSP